jgi:hypothetical protein
LVNDALRTVEVCARHAEVLGESVVVPARPGLGEVVSLDDSHEDDGVNERTAVAEVGCVVEVLGRSVAAAGSDRAGQPDKRLDRASTGGDRGDHVEADQGEDEVAGVVFEERGAVGAAWAEKNSSSWAMR